MTGVPGSTGTVDLNSRPQFRQHTDLVPVGDEAVLYEEDSGDLHRLDAIATTVVSLFDGETSVAEAVALLSDAFEAPREVIERDVLELLADLGSKGLLEGIAPIEDGVNVGR